MTQFEYETSVVKILREKTRLQVTDFQVTLYILQLLQGL